MLLLKLKPIRRSMDPMLYGKFTDGSSVVDFINKRMKNIKEKAIADAKKKGFKVAYEDGDSIFFVKDDK